MRKGISQDRVIQAFKRFKPRKAVEYIAFAGKLNADSLYEVWYDEDDEYYVSFVGHSADEGFYFFESIQELLYHIDQDKRVAESRLEALKEGRIRLWVGSVAFLISIGALLGLGFTERGSVQGAAIISAIVGIAASGALFFFGVWVPSAGKKVLHGTVAEVDESNASPAGEPSGLHHDQQGAALEIPKSPSKSP
jgi:hypothetical protein